MAVWISWNIDNQQSLNSCDSFPRRKFKNRASTRCSPGPVLSPPTNRFELYAKTVEEIDLEKCNFCNFGSLTMALDRVEVTLVHISGRGLPTHQIRWKSEKSFCGRTYGRTDRQTPEFLSTRSSVGDNLKINTEYHSCIFFSVSNKAWHVTNPFFNVLHS